MHDLYLCGKAQNSDIVRQFIVKCKNKICYFISFIFSC